MYNLLFQENVAKILIQESFALKNEKLPSSKYSGEKNNLIPCWFCTFAHWQRNDQSIILMLGLFEQWETE